MPDPLPDPSSLPPEQTRDHPADLPAPQMISRVSLLSWRMHSKLDVAAGLQNPYLDEDIQPLALTETDIDDLVAFMVSLTSANYKEQGATELARQRAISRTTRPQRDTARAFGPKPPRPAPPK